MSADGDEEQPAIHGCSASGRGGDRSYDDCTRAGGLVGAPSRLRAMESVNAKMMATACNNFLR